MPQQFFLYRKKDKLGKEYGPWWARKRRKGHRDLYLNTETDHKPTGQRRAQDWYDSLVAERFGETPRKTFGEVAEEFAKNRFKGLKYKTADRYKSIVNRFIDKWDSIKIHEIGSPHLALYEAERRDQVKPQTIGFEFKVLSIVFKYAGQLDYCEINPVRRYMEKQEKSDIKKRPKRTRYLTHEEEERLLRAAPLIWRTRFVFDLETGLRKEELFSLLRSEVNLREKWVRIRPEIAKTGKERKVPLTERAIAAYRQMEALAPSEYACPKSDGTRVAQDSANVQLSLKRICKAAGLEDVRFHDLRRTCGVRLLQDRRFSMEAVSLWLGHESVKVTQDSYAFLKFDHLQELVTETEGRARLKKARVTVRDMEKSEPLGYLEANQDDDDDRG